jgi:hypothetical protein
MTLEEFNRDIVPILGLGSILLVFWQLFKNNKWNQYNFTYNILNSGRLEDLENKVIEKFKTHNIDIVSVNTIDEETLEIIKTNQGLNDAINEYLNFLENFCIGLKHKAVEKSIAFDALSEDIVRSRTRYMCYIEWIRDDGEDLYSELETQAKEWQDKVKV